jgi:ribosomal protein L11 methylase PrmA
MFDLGCNTGDYSDVALEAGAQYVVGFDYDHGALEQAYHRFHKASKPFLPLWLDAANPSPAQGWAQQERKGLAERASGDFLVALAFIHHIVIGRNVPMGMALDWLIGMAPRGVIEFPPKEDPMVQRLLSTREDIFPDYTVPAFLAALGARARVERTERLAENGRLLALYNRT